MTSKSKQIGSFILGILLIAGAAYSVVKVSVWLWRLFSGINPTVGAGMVAAASTVFVSVFSVLVAKKLEHRAVLQQQIREKKIPQYEEMIRFIFRIVFAEKLGQPLVTESEMVSQMAKFTENIVIWGSEDIVEAWYRFRQVSSESNEPGVQVIFEVEQLLLAIRKDLGHSNKNLSRGKIIGLFVNDVAQHLGS
jgi:hypothetical protein